MRTGVSCHASPVEDKVNLARNLALLDAPYQPGIVGYLNDYKPAVVKVRGEFVWHKHDDTGDFLLVLCGHLTIQLRDRDVELGPGELFVVPRGVEHCPRADEEAHVLLIAPAGTVNTGDAGGELTAPERTI
jgi:mannose-6-phosphate isomerase-like protein (cupin superfamily)